ncbi:MAG: hypothetical protein JSR15_03275 [Proteobacteria bacterium]|nr:hypothetical protein [Pseudomonadota bacterium]
MVETWRGIYPITSFVLEALARKRDASIDGRLSAEEQTLLTAAEFWGAAAHGTLQQHLRPDVRVQLEAARRAFAAIGAVRVVSLLRVAGEELGDGPLHQSETAVIDQLDDRLARTDDNIEDLIARYAGVIERSAESAAAQ